MCGKERAIVSHVIIMLGLDPKLSSTSFPGPFSLRPPERGGQGERDSGNEVELESLSGTLERSSVKETC